jgi:hypothetical protein
VNTAARLIIGLLLLSILVAGGFMLLRGGVYGLTIFVVAPVALGAIAAAVALCAWLVVGLEGLICVAMALSLAVPLGALGSWAVYRLGSSSLAKPSFAVLLLVPSASITWDATVPPTVFEVRSAVEIAASPEQV